MTQSLSFNDRDEFQRRKIGEKLMNLLTSDIDISPMVIDGGWGTGKTEFCQKLIALIKEEKPDYQTVYLDAFRSDHSSEPLLALLAQIIKDCTPEDSDDQLSSERKNLIGKFKKGGAFVAKTALKAVVGHIARQSADDLAGDFQKAMSEADAESMAESVSEAGKTLADKVIDTTVEILLKEQIEAEKDLEALRKSLESFAADKPILLFIDELDRCRPDYAVAMLETIKHVFDVENVKVVLVTNSQQLHAAIHHRYGAAVDAQKYLDKFLKYGFSLPEKGGDFRNELQVLAAESHFCNLILQSSALSGTGLNQRGFIELIGYLIEYHQLSLREVETFVRHLEIYQIYSGNKLGDGYDWGFKLLFILGVFIYCFDSKLAKSIYQNKTDARDFAEFFGISKLPDYSLESYQFSENYTQAMVDVIAVMLIRDCSINSSFILQSEEDKNYWYGKAARYFRNVGYPRKST
ncbi:KAP family P-loop NTPase fold protein [Neisseria sp. CCUG12390]|uniref:KAP family P-loop NTPase fold protein n=1 Tax=Neisseria sp. CCUG12390 TaxID=3392035 RepID=UPI003A0FB89D